MPMTSHNIIVLIIVGYFCAVSIISSLVTIYDKVTAMKQSGQRRIPEKTLITLSVIGGSIAMLVTMLLIRHKTKHIKFMAGIPIIIVMQLIVVFYLLINYAGFEFKLP
jgi:Predicted membrane protein